MTTSNRARMAVRYLLAVVALVWLDELHGALGRSLLVSHGERDIALENALRLPALMEVSRAKARHETDYWAGYRTVEGEYYGTVARINVWGLKLRPGQASVSAMWVSTSSDGSINQIMAGFQISPERYNDTDPHFFVSWTADGFNTTGCLDTDCHGFVRSRHAASASSISPGSRVSRPSVYHGRQTQFTITILKLDRGATRGWWLYVDVRGKQEPVGHFPASLFAGLANHATAVGWGGAVMSVAGTGPPPPMGSGHGPAEKAGGSAYIAGIGVFHSSTGKSNPRVPAAANLTPLTADARGCYRAGSFQIAQHDGGAFYYGGRSGCDQ